MRPCREACCFGDVLENDGPRSDEAAGSNGAMLRIQNRLVGSPGIDAAPGCRLRTFDGLPSLFLQGIRTWVLDLGMSSSYYEQESKPKQRI